MIFISHFRRVLDWGLIVIGHIPILCHTVRISTVWRSFAKILVTCYDLYALFLISIAIREKQTLEEFYKKRRSEKLCNIHRKTFVLEPLCDRDAGYKACILKRHIFWRTSANGWSWAEVVIRLMNPSVM